MAAPLAEKNTNVMMDVTMQMQMHDGQDEQQCQDQQGLGKDVKSMEYHRQMLADRLAQKAEMDNKYVSPSDGLMSPCTAKLSKLRNKKMDSRNVKPKSLFQKASARNIGNGRGSLFDSKPVASLAHEQPSGAYVNTAPAIPEPRQNDDMEN